MGPGIFTKYSKQVIGGILAIFVLFAAVALWYRFRSPIGKVSPYESINSWGDEQVEIVVDEVFYAQQTGPLHVTICNRSDRGLVVPDNYRPKEWMLEIQVNGRWHSMRTAEKNIRWDFPSEDKTPNSGPSGIVKCGEEQTFLCYLSDYYRLPLKPALYRVVFPDMLKEAGGTGTYKTAVAAEFEVIP